MLPMVQCHAAWQEHGWACAQLTCSISPCSTAAHLCCTPVCLPQLLARPCARCAAWLSPEPQGLQSPDAQCKTAGYIRHWRTRWLYEVVPKSCNCQAAPAAVNAMECNSTIVLLINSQLLSRVHPAHLHSAVAVCGKDELLTVQQPPAGTHKQQSTRKMTFKLS